MKRSASIHLPAAVFFILLAPAAFGQAKTGKDNTNPATAASCNFGDFSMPNAFTPNGDGYNDAFCLQGWDKCVEQFSILIFDRWGEKVFESGNPSFCWDGSFNGRLLETDVLIYTVRASFTNGLSINKQGNITLMR